MLDAAQERRIEDLLAEMTLDEKLVLIGGADAWRTNAIPRLGIQPIKVTDGTHGARGGTFGEVPSASFPCGTALGATWDPDLIGEVGAAIAEEAQQKQCHVLLGPTLNLHRHPLAGRSLGRPGGPRLRGVGSAMHDWDEEAGEFEILVGASSAEIAGSARLTTVGPAPAVAPGRVNFIQD